MNREIARLLRHIDDFHGPSNLVIQLHLGHEEGGNSLSPCQAVTLNANK